MFVRRLRVSDLLAVGAIVLTIAWIGLYCVQLRDIFYLQYGPFWDGVSYDDQLAAVMLSVRAGDPVMAIALIYRSTTALPWLEGMLLAPFVAPTRFLGVMERCAGLGIAWSGDHAGLCRAGVRAVLPDRSVARTASGSAQFVTLVYENIGPVAVLACLILFGLNLACALLGREQGRWNLRALWCGLAPLAWLVGGGARP